MHKQCTSSKDNSQCIACIEYALLLLDARHSACLAKVKLGTTVGWFTTEVRVMLWNVVEMFCRLIILQTSFDREWHLDSQVCINDQYASTVRRRRKI
jgi:hypothetical protein